MSHQVEPFRGLVTPFFIHVLVFWSNIFPTSIARFVELLVLLRNAGSLNDSEVIVPIFGSILYEGILGDRSPLPKSMLPECRAESNISQ